MAELWPGGPITLPHEILIDDRRLVVPQIPTGTLLFWLAGGLWWELFPGAMDNEHMLPLTLRWHDDDDDYDHEHLWDVATTLLGRASGLASLDGTTDGYWPGRRLAATALTDWPVYSAWCATHGRPPLGEHLYETTASIYAWVRERAGSEGLNQLDHQLFSPPPYVAAAGKTTLPRRIRDQEAALALQGLAEAMPGEDPTAMHEWTNTPRP